MALFIGDSVLGTFIDDSDAHFKFRPIYIHFFLRPIRHMTSDFTMIGELLSPSFTFSFVFAYPLMIVFLSKFISTFWCLNIGFMLV